MHFSSIKVTARLVTLEIVTKRGEVQDTRRIQSSNEPSHSFREALRGCAEIALEILELSRSYTNFTCTGAAFSIEKDETRGAVLTCVKQVKAAKTAVAINTPYLRERPSETQKEAAGFYIDGMQAALDTLEAEATLYLHGLKRQGDLFDAPQDETAIDPPVAADADGERPAPSAERAETMLTFPSGERITYAHT